MSLGWKNPRSIYRKGREQILFISALYTKKYRAGYIYDEKADMASTWTNADRLTAAEAVPIIQYREALRGLEFMQGRLRHWYLLEGRPGGAGRVLWPTPT